MKTISLTQGKIALVDDADYTYLNQYKWYAANANCTYYAVRMSRDLRPKRQPIYMHRVILNAPDSLDIDHLNGDGLDNRRSNIRLCTRSQNIRHKRIRSDSKSRFKGVNLRKGKKNPYVAYIQLNGKKAHLSCHQTAEAAARVYDEAALKYHGDFALTNEMLGLY